MPKSLFGWLVCSFRFKSRLGRICSNGILCNWGKWMSRGRHYSKCQALLRRLRIWWKLYRSNTCPQSNLNWVMVLHHVTVPRQLTGGPLLCVRGVTCHMIDDTTGVQGLRVMASLNHFVWRAAEHPTCRTHARMPERSRTHTPAHKTQTVLPKTNKRAPTITKTTAATSCSSCSPVLFSPLWTRTGSAEVKGKRSRKIKGGVAGLKLACGWKF